MRRLNNKAGLACESVRSLAERRVAGHYFWTIFDAKMMFFFTALNFFVDRQLEAEL
jgi:hypothetical protein